MEIEVHGAEVDFQFGRVLLLLEELLLGFCLLPGLPLFQFFLGLASIAFLLLVLLLFQIISILLHRSADGLWSASIAHVVQILLGNWLWFS